MALTGKTIRDSKELTPETVKNHITFYNYLNGIKDIDPKTDERLRESMFEQMFYLLSHSA